MSYENLIKTNKDAFLDKVNQVSLNLGVNPSWIMDIIYLESGFNEKAVNSIGATGLIQFTKTTAQSLGFSSAALLLMSNVQQLDVVQKYFEQAFKSYGKPKSFEDLYSLVFYPPWKGAPDGATLPNSAYVGNKAFDSNSDGRITKGEFFAKIYQRLGRSRPSPLLGISTVVLVVGGISLLFLTGAL